MITQKINLNLIPNGVMPRVNVSQYDYGSRTLEITLYNGSSLFTIPTGAQIVIQGTKKDNRGFQYVDLDYSGSVVTADITQQMTVFEDEVQVELVIITGSDDNKQQLATANFILNVEQAALKDDIVVSETDIPAIQTLPEAMAEVNYAVELLEQVVPSIEGSVEESEAWARGTKDNVPVTSEDAQYHNNSKYYAEQASGSAGSAGTNALNAEAFGAGTRNGTDVTSGDAAYQNNAKYYAGQAGNNASAASGSATSASASALDAEAYGIGKRGGVDVESGDVAYHNNSRYYASLASNSANNASTSETNAGLSESAASGYSDESEAWATGEIDGTPVASDKPQYHNSAKWWADQASQAAGGGVTSFNGRSGSVSPADGDYNITQVAPTSGATEGQVVQIGSNGKFTVGNAPSSGHIIKDSTTTFTQRENLKFTGNVSVTDDSVNNATVIAVDGGDGHTIVNASGTEMPTESKLQFGEGFSVADDSTNGKTIVTPDSGVLAKQEELSNLVLTGTTNTSGATIASGTCFVLNGDFVTAKAAIASGATFTLNTNYEKKSVGSVLTELNSNISGKLDGSMVIYMNFDNSKTAWDCITGNGTVRTIGIYVCAQNSGIVPSGCPRSGWGWMFICFMYMASNRSIILALDESGNKLYRVNGSTWAQL